jgi:hypothetical protein
MANNALQQDHRLCVSAMVCLKGCNLSRLRAFRGTALRLVLQRLKGFAAKANSGSEPAN